MDPARVVAIERKFVIPVGDREVSCRLDFAALSEDGSEATVWDYKTSFRMAAMDELATKLPDGRHAAKAAQLLIYVLALAYGFPVRDVSCDNCGGNDLYLLPTGDVVPVEPGAVIPVNGHPARVEKVACPDCDGRGTIEEREPYRIGERVQVFNCSELYPSYLFDDGIGRRDVTVTRAELPDHMEWLESVVARMDESFESWKFQAVPGSHCSECPAARECPLPAHLRDHAGDIDSPEKAAEAAERRMFLNREAAAIWRELKGWAEDHAPVRFGSDQALVYEEESSEEWITGKRIGRPDSAAAREAMQEAIERAIEFGEPFDYADFRRTRTSTKLKQKTLEPDELAEPEPVGAERWGEEAPW